MLETQTTRGRAASYAVRILSPWRSYNFRWYWTGSATQALSQGAQMLVLSWLVLEVSGSSTQVGLVLFLYGLPNVGLLMVGGVIADRVDRKRLLITIQLAVGASISALAALSLAGVIAVWHVYVAAALLGSLQALNQPARVAMVADLVDQRTLLDAVAHFNAAVHIGRIVGPPLVGAIIDHWSISAALLANVACYVISVVCVARIRPEPRESRPANQPMLRNFTDGMVQIWRSPVLLTVLVLACAWGGFGMSHLAVIPPFAKEHLGTEASGAGLLLLASGVGSLAGNLLITFMHRAWLYRWLLVCLVSFLRLPDAVRVVGLVLGVVVAVPVGGGAEPGNRVASGHHHPADVGTRTEIRGPGDGGAPLHAGLPQSGGAAAGRGRRLGGLVYRHRDSGRAVPAGHAVVWAGPVGGSATRFDADRVRTRPLNRFGLLIDQRLSPWTDG